MKRYYYLFFVMALKFGAVSYAQESQEWTTQDSLWLQRVLDGTEKIQLNEKTQKAIEAGTFIHDPTSVKQMKINPAKLPIIQLFEGITAPESQHRQPHELTVSVYGLSVVEQKDPLPDVSRATALHSRIVDDFKMLGTRGEGTSGSGASVSFSAEDGLRTIFWPSHRAKKRNAKHANAWKTYNEDH